MKSKTFWPLIKHTSLYIYLDVFYMFAGFISTHYYPCQRKIIKVAGVTMILCPVPVSLPILLHNHTPLVMMLSVTGCLQLTVSWKWKTSYTFTFFLCFFFNYYYYHLSKYWSICSLLSLMIFPVVNKRVKVHFINWQGT